MVEHTPAEEAEPRRSNSDEDQPRTIARGGAISFVGSATSAILGFAVTILLARSLGESGAGLVLQGIAVFSIVTSVAKLGMDSVAVWLIPRLVISEPGQVRAAMRGIYLCSLSAGFLSGLGVFTWSRGMKDGQADLSQIMLAVAFFIPAGAVLLVAVAVIRGLGDLWAYVLIGNVAVPVLRTILIGGLVLLGSGTLGLTLGWLVPLPLALLAAVLVGRRLRRNLEQVAEAPGGPWPNRGLLRRILGFAIPRTISSGLEQSIQWIDVVIVGAISGSAAAGVYGGASRFIAAGLIVDTAIRVVVSPRFSALLHQGRVHDLQTLYRDVAVWLVLFTSPIYVALAFNATTVLGWLGPGFTSGAPALIILCIGVMVTLIAGNVHSVLLMSGRSGWSASNKAVALTINVAGNYLLLPRIGIAGAAISWVASMLIDAIFASIEVQHFLKVRVQLAPILYALLPGTLCFGIPGAVLSIVTHPAVSTMALNLVIGGPAFLMWCHRDRARLGTDEIVKSFRRS